LTPTDKRIKQEVVTDDSHHQSNAGSPGHVDVTSSMTSSSQSRGQQAGGTLSLPVTISKDFIKELVVSRALLGNSGAEDHGTSATDSRNGDLTAVAPRTDADDSTAVTNADSCSIHSSRSSNV